MSDEKYLYIDAARLSSIEDYLESNDGVFANDHQEEERKRLIFSVDNNIEDAIKAHKEIKSRIESIKTEVSRLNGYAADEAKKLGRLKEILLFALSVKGVKKLIYGIHSITARKIPTSLPSEIDESIVPDAFWVEIPATRRIDRRLLLKGIKSGAVLGIDLVEDKLGLTIR